jgi:hypothetical protein
MLRRVGLDRVEVSVPQAHLPGAAAEVDFAEFPRDDRRGADQAVDVRYAPSAIMLGSRVSCRVRYQTQEAFLEVHALAFEHFGAVPGRIR